jgi:transposase-like protein
MPRPDLTTLACVNAECQHFGRPGQGNLTIRKVYVQDGIRLLRCGSCQEEFSERRNTALFNTKVSEAKAESIMDHLDEGYSVRATSRLTKAAKVTVARLLKTRGRHAQRFHHQEVHDLRPRAIQFDEPWSFVKKKQKNCIPEENDQAGDFWDHTAISPDSKFIVSLGVGKPKLLHTLSLLGYEKINTSSIERHHGTSRLHNQRKVRKTLAFSKSHLYHGWMSWLSVVQYNFCRAHGSLREKDESGVHHRTPAMASGLTDRIWSTREWLLSPILGG